MLIDENEDDLARSVKRQAFDAVELSSVVVFVVDIKQGVVNGDRDIADILHYSDGRFHTPRLYHNHARL